MVFCAGQLAGGNVCPLKKIQLSEAPPSEDNNDKGKDREDTEEEQREVLYVFTDEDAHIKYWFPVLTGFSEIVSHPHIDVRTMYVPTICGVGQG